MTPQIQKHRKKPASNSSLDKELNDAWAETKRKVLLKRGLIEAKQTASGKMKEHPVTPPRINESNSNSSKENDEEISSLTPSRTRHAVSPTRSYASYKSSRSLRSQALNSVRGGNP